MRVPATRRWRQLDGGLDGDHRPVDDADLRVEEVAADGAIAKRRRDPLAVLYLVLLFAIQAANGVAIEKANRISEVLLAIVKPTAPFGKIVGVGIVGLAGQAAGAIPVVVKAWQAATARRLVACGACPGAGSPDCS